MGACCKANLIIHNNMYGAPCAIATQRRKREGLSDHTLTSKSRITMKQHA